MSSHDASRLRFVASRRQAVGLLGAGLAGSSLFSIGARAQAAGTIRQGFQTNIWGMPTHYLLQSGHLEKRGIKAEAFPVASGNLTMQQMVARQVDLGTYAAQSFILGHDKGGLVAIAQIEHVGKSVRVMARKELGLTKVEQLKGLKIGNQTGSSIASVFTDTIGPKAGLRKGDWQEVRMDVNNMVAALSAKTIDAMVNVEPYNAIAEAEGIATTIVDFWDVDKMPLFMVATPDFVQKSPDTIVAYLKAWVDVGRDFKADPKRVSDKIFSFYTDKGYQMAAATFATAMGKVVVEPDFPRDLEPYMKEQAEILLREKKIQKMPDWKVALRPEFFEKARAG